MSETHPRPVRRAALAGLALLPLAAVVGCSSDDGPATTTSASVEAATTSIAGPQEEGPPTTTATTAATVAPATPTSTTEGPTEVALPLEPPPTSPNGTDPAGDGCSPASPDVLPDGTWYGELRSAGPATATFGLDLACFFTADAADAAALADDPTTEVPVPNGYHVRNRSTNVYPLVEDGTATVYLLDPGGEAVLQAPVRGFEAAAPAIDAWSGPVNVWVVVQAGEVVLLQQQFLP